MGGTRRAAGRRVLLVGALCCAVIGIALPGPARADSGSGSVAALLAQVRTVHAETAAALSRYNRALTGLGEAVTQNLSAQDALSARQQEASAAQAALDSRVRALYMSGGSIALYADVLNAGTVADFENRLELVQRVVQVDQLRSSAAGTLAVAAGRTAGALNRAALGQVRTARSVQQAFGELQTLLAEQQTLLGEADGQAAQQQALATAAALLGSQQNAVGQITEAGIAALRPIAPPTSYLALYHAAAATCPGLSWTVLAAVGQVETGHGRDTSTSYAGAMGPMQFLPSTFARYAVDGNHDGIANIEDPADAIFTAAHYLCANGAGTGPSGLYNAIWNYNHAVWYVQMVLTLARQYG